MDFEKQIEKLGALTKKSSLERKAGGPFGALVFCPESGKVIARGFNRVTSLHDPTAHAEIQAIRAACKKLKTHDLSGYCLYATGYPCPMCMSAIIWANIKTVYYTQSYAAAAKIGFRDAFIANFIKGGCKNSKILNLTRIKNDSLNGLYQQYAKERPLY